MKKLLTVVLMLTNMSGALAANESRPKIGLVLSGGGARGAAHIGVIEALEEMQVPIDYIVGTSMGAVIGGLYAAGIPIQTIREDFSSLNWDDIFSYEIRRTDLNFRRKLDSDIFILKNFISYTPSGFHIPAGLISGQRLYETFNRYLLAQQPIKDFNHLRLPFKAVSTNLVTGSPVILDKGDLALSLLASMAVPGIISPIEREDMLLVDGGVSQNLPIEIAKTMGADILIVVNVGTPLSTKAEIVDLTEVLGQITNILTNRNVAKSETFLSAHDILIEPNLKSIDTEDFNKFAQGVNPGKNATFAQRHRLEALSSPAYQGIQPVETSPVRIDEIRIKNESLIQPSTYFEYLSFDSHYVSPQEINEKIDKLYGFSIFDRIYYGIEDTSEGKALVVEPKDLGKDHIYFQGSLLLDTNFRETNIFDLVLGITNEEFNSLLGEWRVIINIGHGEGIFAEIYQPLTQDLAWFVNPSVSLNSVPQTFYYDYDPLAIYQNTVGQLNFAFGRNFGNWGRLSAFWQYENNDIKRRTGPTYLPDGHIEDADVGLKLEWDTLDNLYFPSHGLKGQVTLAAFDKDFGGDSDYNQLTFSSLGAISCGKHAFVLGGIYNRTLDDIPSFSQKFGLGGLFEITGLNTQELLGDNAALISAIYFYKWKKLNIIPNRPLPIYVGATLEEGKVWGRPNLSQNDRVGSASVFVGADSILGPIYFAVGATDTGHQAVHLTLRPVFK